MKQKMVSGFFLGLFVLVLAAPQALAGSVGLQASAHMAAVGIDQGLIGFKIDQGPFAITPRFGFGIDDRDRGDTVVAMTMGGGFDYYLSEANVRPYVGGDCYMHVVDTDDTDVSVSLNPHLGAEYRFNEEMSIGGNVGLQFGLGDIGDSEFRVGTTAMIHLTHYF